MTARETARLVSLGRYRRVVATSAATLCVTVALTAPMLACPICFQAEQGPVTDGVRAAVLVLMAVTAAVLAGFARFVVGFVRRSRCQ